MSRIFSQEKFKEIECELMEKGFDAFPLEVATQNILEARAERDEAIESLELLKEFTKFDMEILNEYIQKTKELENKLSTTIIKLIEPR